MRSSAAACLGVAIVLTGCNTKSVVYEPGSPEAAVMRFDEAMKMHNLDAAVECRAFEREAELEFKDREAAKKKSDSKEGPKKTPTPQLPAGVADPSMPPVVDDRDERTLINQFAGIREFYFRDNLIQKGYPNLNGVTTTLKDKKQIDDSTVLFTKIQKFPDGQTKEQEVYVVRTAKGWQVYEPPVGADGKPLVP